MPGHMGCPGCGASLAMRYVLEVLGPKTMVIMPAGCWPTFVGLYPSTCLKVPVMSVPFATTAMAAAGCAPPWTPGQGRNQRAGLGR